MFCLERSVFDTGEQLLSTWNQRSLMRNMNFANVSGQAPWDSSSCLWKGWWCHIAQFEGLSDIQCEALCDYTTCQPDVLVFWFPQSACMPKTHELLAFHLQYMVSVCLPVDVLKKCLKLQFCENAIVRGLRSVKLHRVKIYLCDFIGKSCRWNRWKSKESATTYGWIQKILNMSHKYANKVFLLHEKTKEHSKICIFTKIAKTYNETDCFCCCGQSCGASCERPIFSFRWFVWLRVNYEKMLWVLIRNIWICVTFHCKKNISMHF